MENNSLPIEGGVSPKKKKFVLPPKSKMTTYIMFFALFLFILLFIIFFNVGDGYKTQYSDYNVKALGEGLTEEWKNYYLSMADWAGSRYTVFAVLSYVCSLLALISLGAGLAISDKFKQKEEEVAERE